MTNFSIGATSFMGPRKVLEDQFVIKEKFLGQDTFLVAVFDGHAGDSAAKIAAKFLPNEIKNLIKKDYSPKNIEDSVSEAFRSVSAQIRSKTDSGTTATILLIVGSDAYLANVGDSQAMLVAKNGKWAFLTHNHNVSDLSEGKTLMEKGGLVHRGYLWSKLGRGINLSRALGDREFSDWISDEPDVSHFELKAEFANIVLATDGLWNFLDEEKVVEVLKKGKDPQKGTKVLANLSIESMKTQGWGDNITILIVGFN